MEIIADNLARDDVASFVSALNTVLGKGKRPIPLHEPVFSGKEWDYVKDCIDTAWVSYGGSYVSRFEKMLADIAGVPSCVAVVNGTVALEMSLRAGGIVRGDEVLTPSLTFVATTNAINHVGAIPHFVDSDAISLGVDVDALEQYLLDIVVSRSGQTFNRLTGRRIAAVMPMHCFGNSVNMDPLIALAERYSLVVIEDATEALGSSYRGRACGGIAPIACLSFNGNKIVTTGAGGAILLHDVEVAKRLKHLTTTAKKPHPWEFYHDEAAWNYRLPNLNAALGCATLERLPALLEAKRKLQQQYEEAFTDFRAGVMFREATENRSNYWLCTMLLKEKDAKHRDVFLSAAQDAGYLCRAAWRLNHELPMYQDQPRMPLTGAINLQPRIVNLPSSPHLARSAT